MSLRAVWTVRRPIKSFPAALSAMDLVPVWRCSVFFQHFVQPERRSGYDDKGSQPHGTCNRRGIPDSVRSDSEAGCDRSDHAAVGTGRRSGYDVPSIVVSGIQLITKEKMTSRNLTIVSVALGVGYGMGVMQPSFQDAGSNSACIRRIWYRSGSFHGDYPECAAAEG